MSEALVTNYDEIAELKGQLAELRQNRTMKKLSETYKELGIAFSFPIEIKDAEGNDTYYEDSGGCWYKYKYDADGSVTYYEGNGGCWYKYKYDAEGNRTYCEDRYGYWGKWEYDAKGNKTHFEDSGGCWYKYKYDAEGNQTYSEDSDGYWRKSEYDANGNQTYYENSCGYKNGTPRSQSCDGKVIEVDGKKYKLTEL
jgi:YD repeat-containing protein